MASYKPYELALIGATNDSVKKLTKPGFHSYSKRSEYIKESAY